MPQEPKKKGGPVNLCPFDCTEDELDDHGYCHHLIGFMVSSKTFEVRGKHALREEKKPKDQIIAARTCERVYRKEGHPEVKDHREPVAVEE